MPSRTTFKGDAGDTSEPGGDIAVTEDAVGWVSDPAARYRVANRSPTQQGGRYPLGGGRAVIWRWPADGMVWASSDTRLLGLGGS